MKIKNHRYSIIIFSILAISIVLLLVSYSNAKRVAEIIMESAKPEFYLSECNFSILSYEEGRPVNKLTSFGWQILYHTNEAWTNDLELYITLTGRLVATNPGDLQNLLVTYRKIKRLNKTKTSNFDSLKIDSLLNHLDTLF
jgi:hypothetical protein